ncbi:MAG: hypothetical protein ACOC5T_02915 [Elusimicrobiota bacterium]
MENNQKLQLHIDSLDSVLKTTNCGLDDSDKELIRKERNLCIDLRDGIINEKQLRKIMILETR